jgi:hypothetical protein
MMSRVLSRIVFMGRGDGVETGRTLPACEVAVNAKICRNLLSLS